ncbi:hypothetical protein EIK77_006617 [Talaromyces pinophilus]|nr:hypothetical protein EIK77_006617 [Talaromyces pinophilus]
MKRRLAKKPELLDQMLPDFPPGCRRLTPGPGYLEALTDEKVDVIKTEISNIDSTGITTADGVHREVDVIVCATGFDTTYLPRFPMTGRKGISLAEKWKDIPETYISLATNEFPNYFICLGPNAALGHGSLILLIEKEIDYITQSGTRVVKKMDESSQSGLVRLLLTTTSFILSQLTYWKGSSLHALKTFSNPRWEDFEYEYINDNPNGWIGDGWTAAEKLRSFDVNYLDDDQVDFPTPVEVEVKKEEEKKEEPDVQETSNTEEPKNSSTVHIENVAVEAA